VLFKNTLAQSASFAVGYLFSFLLAPIMISRLGLDKFGVWAVTGAFTSYAGLLDLGIGRSLGRFVAVFDARGEDAKIRECIGLGLLTVLVVGTSVAAALAALAPLLHDNLGVISTAEMRVVAVAAVAIGSFNGVGGVLNVVAIGKRKMIRPNIAITIGSCINFAFSITALLLSTSLAVYATANAAATAVAIVPSYFFMRHLWHRPRFAMPGRELIREVLGFSVKNQVGWIADLINFQTDKVVIGFLVDVRAAAIYEIAARIVIAVHSAAVLSVSAMLPTAAARFVSEGKEILADMYRRYTLRSCAVAFPLFVLSAVSAPFLLVAWLGDAPGESALLVPLLTFAYIANMTTGVGTTLAISSGHPGFASANSVQIAILNVVFTVALAPAFGLWGVAGGTFLAVTLGSTVFNLRFLRRFELSLGDFLAGVVPTGALALGLGIPPAALAIAVGVPSGRASAIPLLIVSVAVYVIPYWLIATRRGLLPRNLEFPPLRRRDSIASPA
jgi:O-antigen/teichoic acid export membrane protein